MSWLDNFYEDTRKAVQPLYGPGPDNSAVMGEIAAQNAMQPRVRANYYEGLEMPKDPRIAGWKPTEHTFDERFAPMGSVAATDSYPDSPFERAALRTIRPYRQLKQR